MSNIPYIIIQKTSYGHWRISTDYYGKEISCITTNSIAIDNYNSEDDERKGRKLRRKMGAADLRNEIISYHKQSN